MLSKLTLASSVYMAISPLFNSLLIFLSLNVIILLPSIETIMLLSTASIVHCDH